MSEGGVVEVAVVALGAGIIAALLWRDARLTRRVVNGDFEGRTLGHIARVLWDEYLEGRVRPEFMSRLPPSRRLLGLRTTQRLVCLDVAAGRYAEALQWQTHPRWRIAENERLLQINLAEARACLGQLEEALATTEFADKVESDWLKAGLAAHRAWVLSELGRPQDAKAELQRSQRHSQSLGPFEAEWYFAAFTAAFAERDWAAAEAALESAARVAVRATTKRNLHFLRGRLAFAKGELQAALKHFDEGGRHVYRCQGGPALLDWGRALHQLGRIDEARAIWERCRVEDPQSPAAAEALRLLNAPRSANPDAP